MSRGKLGSKANRAQANAEYQRNLRERKRLRKERAARHVPVRGPQPEPIRVQAHGLPPMMFPPRTEPYTRSELERYSMGPLRDIARENGLKPGRTRKAELIDQIMEAQG